MKSSGYAGCRLEQPRKYNEASAGCKSERRQEERRVTRRFRWREMRSGFDNRLQLGLAGPALFRALPRRLAVKMRECPALLLYILLLLNLFNFADYFLTVEALAAGHKELNPVMRSLFEVNPLLAGIFKTVIMLAVTAGIWQFRKFRLILQFSLFALCIYMALIGYHVYGIILTANFS
jgi:hypothetical protein